MAIDPDREPDLIAAELALGVLDGDERAAAIRRQLAEPAFAHEVQVWRDRFAALFAIWPERAPPPYVERRVMAAIDQPRAIAPRRFVAGLALGAVAATLILTVAILPLAKPPVAPIVVQAPVVAPSLLAAIANTNGGAPMAALYDRTTGEIRLAGAIRTPAQRSAELWAIHGSEAPQPLGLIGQSTKRLLVAAARRGVLVDGTVLAISIEPVGGSKTGAPTGPVIATGALATV